MDCLVATKDNVWKTDKFTCRHRGQNSRPGLLTKTPEPLRNSSQGRPERQNMEITGWDSALDPDWGQKAKKKKKVLVSVFWRKLAKF